MKSIPIYYIRNRFLKHLLIWSGFGARYWFFCILIDSQQSARDQERLLTHELHHHQQAMNIGRFNYFWKYLTNKKFRFEIEYDAYYKIDHLQYGCWENQEVMVDYIKMLYNC